MPVAMAMGCKYIYTSKAEHVPSGCSNGTHYIERFHCTVCVQHELKFLHDQQFIDCTWIVTIFAFLLLQTDAWITLYLIGQWLNGYVPLC